MVKPLICLQRDFSGDGVLFRLIRRFGPAIEKLLSISELNSIYSSVQKELVDVENDEAFFMKTLRVMGVHFEVDAKDFERIPKDQPLIVISNHPYGGIDGVVMGALLKGIRSDAKLMGNYLLAQMEGIRGSIIQVDPFGGDEASRSNLKGMREAMRHLKSGGCLGAFPAGEVSSFQIKTRAVLDPLWSDHIVALAEKTGAGILPIYFEGRNSLLFQVAGMLHPRLRTLLLPREFCRAKCSEIQIRVGSIIEADRMKRFDSRAAATEYLRLKTYSLRDQKVAADQSILRLPFRSFASDKVIRPLAAPQLPSVLAKEITSLPQASRLVEHGDLEVYCVESSEIPNVLNEIGRLREQTFRAAKEGTGKERDLDEFDAYYLHLFMWNRVNEEIVGAYRIGLADKITDQFGKEGLYTSTLFRFRSQFIDKLGPSIELGRSFIRLEYQKKHSSLAVLWRGIGEFIARHPEYRTLFGPVSITDAYNNISKDLMISFFREHKFDVEMSRYVRPRNKHKSSSVFKGVSIKQIGESIRSVDSVSAIISGFEADQKGVPVLLKHYLKLNGALLSFNVDPAFSDVIDGLILVDLCKTEPKILQRYMGQEGYANFADYHEIRNETQSATPVL